MKLNYKNNIEDIINFKIFNLKNDSSNKKRIMLLRLVLPIVSIAVCYMMYSPNLEDITFNVFVIFCAIISFISIIFYPKFYYWKIRQALSKKFNNGNNNNLLSARIIELNEKCITQNINEEQHKFPWANIKKVIITNTYLYIYIDILTSIIIPLKSFNNTVEKDSFLKYINKYINIENYQN